MRYKVGQYLSRKRSPNIVAQVTHIIDNRVTIQQLKSIGNRHALGELYLNANYDIIGDDEDLKMYLMGRSLNE